MTDVTSLLVALKAGRIARYHNVPARNPLRQNVAEHTYNVLMIALYLSPDMPRSMILAALFHDEDEHYTGDIPSPVKRNLPPGALPTPPVNKVLVNALLADRTNPPERLEVVKIADVLEGLIHSSQQNDPAYQEVADVYLTYLQELMELHNGYLPKVTRLLALLRLESTL